MKHTRIPKTFAVLGALGLSLAAAYGQASLTYVTEVQLNDNISDGGSRIGISVKDGQAGYRTTSTVPGGVATGTFGDGTLFDWQIHTGPENPFAGATISTGPGTYFDTPSATENAGNPQNYFDVWTTSDIATDPANITTGTTPSVGQRSAPVVGNIDISTLEDGQLYVIKGTYQESMRTVLTMTGPGKSPITLTRNTPGHGSKNRMYSQEFTFNNPGGEYTNIRYDADCGNNSGRRRWGGLALDGSTYVDTIAPEWATTAFPNINPVGSTLLGVNGSINESGTVYYVVLPDGASAPSSAQVAAGTDGTGSPGVASGNFALEGLEEGSTLVTGLTASTAYDIYVVAEDVRGPNIQATPTLFDVTTNAPDFTPPSWTPTYPKVDRSPAGLTGIANINEFGVGYFVVLASGASAPSSAQVKAGQDSSSSPAPFGSGSIPGLSSGTDGSDIVGGLTVGTTYDVYFVAEDLEGNLQAAPVLVVSAPAAAVDQFVTGAFAWGTDSVWSTLSGGPYTNAWGDGNNAVFEGGSSTIAVDSGTTVNNMTFNSNNWKFQGGPLTLAGPTTPTINTNGNLADFESILSGTQGLIKEGTGTMRFDSNVTPNTITGGWALNGGNLGDNSGNLGASELNGNTVTTNGASNVGITFRAGNTYPSDFVLNAPFTRMSNNNGSATITGTVTGPGGIELNQTGGGQNLLILTNTANTFTGGVNYTNGLNTLLRVTSFADTSAPNAASNIRLGVGTGNGRWARFELSSAAIAPLTLTNRQFDVAGSNDYDPEIWNSSSQPFTINSDLVVSYSNSKELTLRGSGTGVSTFAGAMGDGSSPLSLRKSDNGTWVLSGANTYTGGTTVAGGSLTIDGSLADASMTISSGSVGGSGTLTFNVDGTTIDLIDANGGTFTASGLTVNINPTGSGLTEAEYTLVDATGATLVGTFAGLTGAPGYVLDYSTPNLVKLVGGATSAFNDWAASNGVPADSEAVDSDTGGLNNLGEFGLGGNPTDGNDDGSLLHAFSDNVAGGAEDEGILTILVRTGASFGLVGNDQVSAAVDGIIYTVAGDSTIPVASGSVVTGGIAAVTTGLDPAPAGYEYASFYVTGPEGYFQVTVTPAP